MSSRTAPRLAGVVTTWNDDRGFGFIKPEGGGKDIFLHFTALERGAARPYQGQKLTFEVAHDDTGRTKALFAEPLVEAERAEPAPPPTSVVVGIGSISAFFTLYLVAGWRWGMPLSVGALYVALSILAFVMYAADKRAARRRRWRTPETTLLLVGLIGGWPGAIVAQQVLRHKTRKLSFRAKFWLSVIVNVAVFTALTWYFADHPIPGFSLF
jgi:uncharacterized membrane protein YsdA (DUF1294 family)/cold shock CspA family protein